MWRENVGDVITLDWISLKSDMYTKKDENQETGKLNKCQSQGWGKLFPRSTEVKSETRMIWQNK